MEYTGFKINTVLSIPLKFPVELFRTVNPNQQIMSIIPRDCKVIKKSQALPELFILEFVASNIPADVNLVRVNEALEKKINFKEELLKIGKYWAQYPNDLSLRDDCVWLDGRLVIPLPLQVPIESRIHYYHHGKRNLYEAARDVWYPYMYRSLAAKATYCQQCTEAEKNLKSLLPKGDMGKVPEPREPNECIQLDFWGPINYLNESKKYVLVATDRFSRWPSAVVTTTNTSDKVLKFLDKYQGSGDTGSNIQGSGGARDLYQRTTSKTLNRYKLLKSDVISELEHTIKLKNGSVLRQSAVAGKPKPTLLKKRKPATLKEMLSSAKKGAIESPKSKRLKAMQNVSVATFQSDSSDSEDYQPLNIIPARLPIKVLARHEAIAAGQGPSGSTAVAERGTGSKAKSRVSRAKRGKGGQDKPGKGSQERPALVARECLVNSSQEEDVESGSQSESSGTRRSTRRRKPVDKMGGVMIENIHGAEHKEKHPGVEGK